MNLRRPKHIPRELDNDDRISLREQVRTYWRRLCLFPLLKKLLRPQASTPPLSNYSNSVSPYDVELVKVARPPDPACITPSAGIQPESTLVRSSTQTSERGSLTITTTTYLRHSQLEPIRRSFTTTYQDPDTSVSPGMDLARDLTLSSAPIYEEFEQPRVGLIDMRITDSPISLHVGGSPVVGESGDQAPIASPGRIRTPTYGTMFSQYSTLPLYREQDDQMSMVSQAPTYISCRSTRVPCMPFRSGRLPQPTKC